MSDTATVESVIPTPVENWMGDLPTERPEKVEPTPVKVVDTVAPTETVEAVDATPETPSATETAATVTDQPRDTETGKFTSKARQEMQKRIDKLTAKNKDLESKLTTPKPAETATTETPSTADSPAYSVPMPTMAQFEADPEKYPDPYQAHILALAKWEIRKEDWDKAQANQSTQQQVQAYRDRIAEFKQSTPDWDDVVKNSPVSKLDIGPLLYDVITGDDNGPEISYYLAQHEDEALDLIAKYGDLPPTQQNLTIVRRKFALRLASVSRGSETETPVVKSDAPPPAGRLGAGTRTTTERAIDLAAKGGEDFDASGYAARRREELKRR